MGLFLLVHKYQYRDRAKARLQIYIYSRAHTHTLTHARTRTHKHTRTNEHKNIFLGAKIFLWQANRVSPGAGVEPSVKKNLGVLLIV